MTIITTKNEAFKILDLSPDTPELEIKKTYRKLSLQNHPKNKGDSEESKKKSEEIQEAYKVLSADWPPKKYFGFSEEEIEKFESEEIEELKKIPGVDDYSIGRFSESIEDVKKFIGFVTKEAEPSELVIFCLPKEREILNDWLNRLHLMYGLGYKYMDEEISGWVESTFFDDGWFRLLEWKKKYWDRAREGLKNAFSESEWKEHLKILQRTKSIEEMKYKFHEELLNLKRRKEVKQEINKSQNTVLLSDIINVEVSFQFDAPLYQEGEDYWVNWMNSSWSDAERKQEIIFEILKEHNNPEVLAKEKATRYYEVLKVSEEATQEEIKKSYWKLAQTNHSDKGGEDKSFTLINKAYEVLGDEVGRKKYDLALATDEEGFYLNRKKWSKIKKSNELINEEFRKDLELILEDELKLNDLTWEDLNWCGEKLWKKNEKYFDFRKRKGDEIELIKIEDFCHEVLSDEMSQYEATQKARDYLELADNVFMLVREVTKKENKSKIIERFEKKKPSRRTNFD